VSGALFSSFVVARYLHVKAPTKRPTMPPDSTAPPMTFVP
jgi:hypothetical protein